MLLSSCTTSVRSKLGYEASLINASVVILPPAASVSTVDVLGKEEKQYDYEYHIEKILAKRLADALKNHNFKVHILNKGDVVKGGLIKNVSLLQNRYNSSIEELYQTVMMNKEIATNTNINFGKTAVELGSSLKTDLMFLISYHHKSKTAGARALAVVGSLLVNSSMAEETDISYVTIGILDAKKGDLLWVNKVGIAEDFYDSAIKNSLYSNEERDSKSLDDLISLCLLYLRNN